MSTYDLRKAFVDIARLDKGKVEETKNHAPWIEKLWPATSYPEGYKERAPYCAAGVAYCVSKWLESEATVKALGEQKSHFLASCRSAAAFGWLEWAKRYGFMLLPKECILHMGDLVVYEYSHIEIVTDDDNTPTGPFVAIGYNTNASASADGEGCFEKPRIRAKVKAFIRLLA